MPNRSNPHDQCAILVLTMKEIKVELEFIVLRETEDGAAKFAGAYFIKNLSSSWSKVKVKFDADMQVFQQFHRQKSRTL